MFNKFFDCLNVGNCTSGKHTRNAFKDPYRSATDFRLKVKWTILGAVLDLILFAPLLILQWLEEVFLPYLAEWERSVTERPGFSRAAKKRMLLSAETLLGL